MGSSNHTCDCSQWLVACKSWRRVIHTHTHTHTDRHTHTHTTYARPCPHTLLGAYVPLACRRPDIAAFNLPMMSFGWHRELQQYSPSVNFPGEYMNRVGRRTDAALTGGRSRNLTSYDMKQFLLYARTHTRKHARKHTSTHARTHATTNVCTDTRTHAHSHTRSQTHVFGCKVVLSAAQHSKCGWLWTSH